MCESRERHRLAWLFLCRRTNLLTSTTRMLHVSPEFEISRRLGGIGGLRYWRGDLAPRHDLALNIQQLPFRDGSFDFIYCSHVLNMVRDDAAAIGELSRVLGPGGWALLQVPLREGQTLESAPEAGPERCAEMFGDPSIRRSYGSDFAGRLAGTGFGVRRLAFHEELTPAERKWFAAGSEDLFLVEKAGGGTGGQMVFQIQWAGR